MWQSLTRTFVNQAFSQLESGRLADIRREVHDVHIWQRAQLGVPHVPVAASSLCVSREKQATSVKLGAHREVRWKGQHVISATPLNTAWITVKGGSHKRVQHGHLTPWGGPAPARANTLLSLWLSFKHQLLCHKGKESYHNALNRQKGGLCLH